jgi:hypothetical protein
MNRLYFVCATALFLLSCYQVEISASVITKQNDRVNSLMAQAFEAGCVVTKGRDCQKAANEYLQGLEEMYQ